MLSHFEVVRFRLMAVLDNLRLFPHQIFRGPGEKFLKVSFWPRPLIKLVCKFRGDPLRDG